MVDHARSCLLLEDETTKAGARVHPIGPEALAIVAGQVQRGGIPWVFVGRDGVSHVSGRGVEGVWERVRKLANLEDVRLHDLRHTVGTYAGQTDASSFMVRDLLGHKTLAMTGLYVNRDLAPVLELSRKVGNRIATAMKGGKPPSGLPKQPREESQDEDLAP